MSSSAVAPAGLLKRALASEEMGTLEWTPRSDAAWELLGWGPAGRGPCPASGDGEGRAEEGEWGRGGTQVEEEERGEGDESRVKPG